MSSLLSLIKQAAMDAVLASNPLSIVFGEIASIDPFEVIVDQRYTLTADFLIVPESLTKLELKLEHTHKYTYSTDTGSTTKKTQKADYAEPIIIRKGLEIGDKVILLRLAGGQQYLILDRMVEDDT